jgi:ketosteroid isomerase-like protein
MKHPNLELAEQAWEAVARSDIEALEALWTPGIVWHVTGDNPWKGDHVGRDAVFNYLADVGEAGEAYDAILEDILVSPDRVMIVCRVKATRGDRAVDTCQCMLFRIEDGRMAEVWTLPLDPSAFDGFWQAGARDAEPKRQAELQLS